GIPGRSCAFEVAGRLGFPKALLVRARDFMKAEHIALEDLVKSVRQEEEALRHELVKVEELRRRHRDSLESLKIESEQIKEKAAEELRKVIEEAKSEFSEIADEFRRNAIIEGKKPTRRQVKKAEEQARTRMNELIGRLVKKISSEDEKDEIKYDINVGDLVEVKSLGKNGRVIGFDRDGRMEIRIGQFRMWFSPEDLVKLEVSGTGNADFDELRKEKLLSIKPELDLRGQRLEEAMDSLGKYLDDALLAGITDFRVIHGKGQGILKKAVGEFLKNNPHVAEFRLGEVEDGSWGVTVVKLK
ncbi:MAG: Smr/MutS family protein, partial [Candidatus Eremiobacteraeota bacterium]|nr:Smr/MutS family protein [Candidatus Eremiobacteraeota bacterium]